MPSSSSSAVSVTDFQALLERHSLSFVPTESPPWRPDGYPSTSQLLKNVIFLASKFDNWSPNSRAKQWVDRMFVKTTAVEYVLSSNQMENLGTLDLTSTLSALGKLLEDPLSLANVRPPPTPSPPPVPASQKDDGSGMNTEQQDTSPSSAASAPEPTPLSSQVGSVLPSSQGSFVGVGSVAYQPDVPPWQLSEMTPQEIYNMAVMETKNTLRAMQKLDMYAITKKRQLAQRKPSNSKYGPRSGDTFALKLDELNETHGVLMKDLIHPDKANQRGAPRTEPVVAASVFFGDLTAFGDPMLVPNRLSILLQHLNTALHDLPDNFAQRIEMCFRLAALVAFQFVDLHPYINGNGRMCRLLASRCVAPVTPFPVPLRPALVRPLPFKWPGTLYKDGISDPESGVAIQRYTKHGSFQINTDRDIYTAALEICRFDSNELLRRKPCLLAAMLIEQAHRLWAKAMTELKELGYINSSLEPTPVVNLGQVAIRLPPLLGVDQEQEWPFSLITVVREQVTEQYKHLRHDPLPSLEQSQAHINGMVNAVLDLFEREVGDVRTQSMWHQRSGWQLEYTIDQAQNTTCTLTLELAFETKNEVHQLLKEHRQEKQAEVDTLGDPPVKK